MMGRWRNGAPLALRPTEPEQPAKTIAMPEDVMVNDFAYAQDDPQGLRCPLGAHIRRANPRDGLRPGDDLQQAITNRHRLLRRGRVYEIPGREAEKGIMFTCLCADLERQFEFVQQTWIGSSSFHGLTGEVDPIIGSPDPKKGGCSPFPRRRGPSPSTACRTSSRFVPADTSSCRATRRCFTCGTGAGARQTAAASVDRAFD